MDREIIIRGIAPTSVPVTSVTPGSPWSRFQPVAATGVAERWQNAPVDSLESQWPVSATATTRIVGRACRLWIYRVGGAELEVRDSVRENTVGCCTGRSAGLAPRSTLST